MKVTLEIKTSKTFEIDSDVYQYVEGLEGQEAMNKIIEVIGEWDNHYDTATWDEGDKLDLLREHAGTITWTDEIINVEYEQRYRVYDHDEYKTLFRGSYEECSQYLTNRDWTGRDINIVEA